MIPRLEHLPIDLFDEDVSPVTRSQLVPSMATVEAPVLLTSPAANSKLGTDYTRTLRQDVHYGASKGSCRDHIVDVGEDI